MHDFLTYFFIPVRSSKIVQRSTLRYGLQIYRKLQKTFEDVENLHSKVTIPYIFHLYLKKYSRLHTILLSNTLYIFTLLVWIGSRWIGVECWSVPSLLGAPYRHTISFEFFASSLFASVQLFPQLKPAINFPIEVSSA